MIDGVEQGSLVSIRGRVLLIDDDALTVSIGTGAQTFGVLVPFADVIEVLPDDAPAEPLAVGDKVTDSAGHGWEVLAPARENDAGRQIVALWHEDRGVDWDYPENLRRAEDG